MSQTNETQASSKIIRTIIFVSIFVMFMSSGEALSRDIREITTSISIVISGQFEIGDWLNVLFTLKIGR